MSPRPKPSTPLQRNRGNAWPAMPWPRVCAHKPNSTVARMTRQKFASIPPSALLVRCAHTPETENRMVVKNAGNIAACVTANRSERQEVSAGSGCCRSTKKAPGDSPGASQATDACLESYLQAKPTESIVLGLVGPDIARVNEHAHMVGKTPFHSATR